MQQKLVFKKKFQVSPVYEKGRFYEKNFLHINKLNLFQTNFLISCPGHSKISFGPPSTRFTDLY